MKKLFNLFGYYSEVQIIHAWIHAHNIHTEKMYGLSKKIQENFYKERNGDTNAELNKITTEVASDNPFVDFYMKLKNYDETFSKKQ